MKAARDYNLEVNAFDFSQFVHRFKDYIPVDLCFFSFHSSLWKGYGWTIGG